MYSLHATSAFKKGYKRMAKRGYPMDELDFVIQELLSGRELPAKYLDHPLRGQHLGNRECHIQDDWLLEYTIQKKQLVLVAVNTGTHQDLFEN